MRRSLGALDGRSEHARGRAGRLAGARVLEQEDAGTAVGDRGRAGLAYQARADDYDVCDLKPSVRRFVLTVTSWRTD